MIFEMNIGIVTTWFERGAAYVSKQFEDVLCEAHNVYIYARAGEKYAKGDPNWDHPNVYWSKRYSGIITTFIYKREFIKWIKKYKIDLILFNEQHYFEPILWAKELGVKTVAYIDYYTEQSVPLFNVYDAVICNTRRHFSAFEEHHNAIYLPWGTDVELYKPKSATTRLVKDGIVTFFTSSGMDPKRKGTDKFIQALNKCKNTERIKAVVHTQVDLKNCFPELSEMIEELQASGLLEIVEGTFHAPGLYYRGDVYVYPSILDGLGLTVAEAVSSGLACVVSDNPPMNEFVDSSYGDVIPINRLYSRSDGYYWPMCRCDENALAEIIDDYVNNPEKVIEMKSNARKYAIEHFSFQKNAKKLSEQIQNVKLTQADEKLTQRIYSFDHRGLKKIGHIMNRFHLNWILRLRRL